MPIFQTNFQPELEQITQIVKDNWNLTLGKLIQTCQNFTYEGFRTTQQGLEQKFAVRVSPDLENQYRQRIQDEIFFVNYLTAHKLNNIASFAQKTSDQGENKFVHFEDKFSIVVINWVNGQSLPFVEFEWMKNQKIVHTWGQFFAQLHQLSKQFEKQHSEVAKRIQSWRQIHNGLLNGIKLDEADEKDVQNPDHYGVIHGDLNISNFLFDKTNWVMNVYDTDQVQRGFFLWDVSRAIFTSFMLQNAGMPNEGKPVPEADYKVFSKWIVEGYQSVTGKGSVDRERLERMVLLNKEFYVLFAEKALQEGNMPAGIRTFLEYLSKHLAKKQ